MPNEVAANYLHTSRILDTGGISRASTKKELTQLIQLYLEDKSINSKGRKTITANETGPNKGNSGEVIGRHIVSLVNKL